MTSSSALPVTGMIGLALMALALLGILILGGCDLVQSNLALNQRGYVATEPHPAPGFQKLLLPKGWMRDTRLEYIEDNLVGRPQSPNPRTVVHMGSPDEAWLHFQIGQYSHPGGTVTPVTATLFARPLEAPRWTMADLDNGLGREGARLRLLRREGGIEVYVDDNDAAANEEFPWVVLNDSVRGLRLRAAAGKTLYTQGELITLGRSILENAKPDNATLSAARTAARAAEAVTASQVTRSLALVQAAFRLPEPIGPGLIWLNDQSPAWQSGKTLNAFVRIGTVSLAGLAPQKRAAALKTDMVRLKSLVDAHPGGTLAIYNPNDLQAAWVEGDAIQFWSVNDGTERMTIAAPHPLYAALRGSLPAGELGLYREDTLYLPEQDRVTAWFALTAAYQKAQAAQPPLVQ